MPSDLMATSWFVSVLSRHWPIVLVAGGFYVFMSIRVARQMGKTGRSTLKWFSITLCFTAIPAGVVLLWDSFGWLIRGKPKPDDGCEAQDQ